MSNIFLVCFLFLVLLHIILDMKKMRSQQPSLKAMYFILYSVTITLFISMLWGVKFPMPSYFFVNDISTWVHKTLQA
ncbi:hypothetical protein [Paenibacillus rigui]|uniref:Uncharacterized protein n=1 Tax=Paenibacillus rigui TaxID=554312 RepID=A0A229UMD5_9BACL|nr:hypothetical protein [Paenibacillus rigui]OXM84455.1 hypothetical protein CF651_20495 [Paenibacillus rigui]